METNNKLRKTMIEVLEYIETFHKYITPGKGKKLTALFAVADTIRDKARAALAEPVKNCEVGTVGEQDERFSAFCNRHFDERGLCDKACPCRDFNMIGGTCSIVWAQMPYEEGGDK
jgi:hypothetical protein